MFRTRLAALDEMAETSRQALSVAPADPVLNQYYLSTLGAREVTLRQLGSVLTAGHAAVTVLARALYEPDDVALPREPSEDG